MSTTPRPESEPGSARYTRYARAVSYDANAAMTGTADETIRLADSEQAVLVARVAELEAEVTSLRMRYEASQGALSDLLTEHREDAEAFQRGLAAAEAIEPQGSGEWVESGRAMQRTMLHTIRTAALASAGRPATSGGEDANGDDIETVGTLLRNGEGHLPSGLTVDLLGIAVDMEAEGRPLFAKWLRLMSAATLPASPVVAPSATDEDGGQR